MAVISRHPFTPRQWAAALGVAVLLHAAFAGAWLALVLERSDTPAGHTVGLAVASLALSGPNLPMLSDVAATRSEQAALTRAVAPPEVRPMSEPVPVAPRQRPPQIRPAPRAEPQPAKAREAQRSRAARNPRASDKQEGRTAGNRPQSSDGRQGGPDPNSAVGADRAAAPAPGNARPRYPRLARRRGQEGRVVIRVSVLGDGRVGSAEVASSSGYSALDRAALQAVERWRFEPARRAGKAVTATLTVPVVFRLEG